MTEITPVAIESLKRDAKRARKSDPSLTHAQHLDALAAQKFGVRGYHELLQRAKSARQAAPACRVIAMGTTGMGTGKTSILLNLAGYLAGLGGASKPFRVLLVDCDGDLSPAPASAFNWLAGRAPSSQALPFALKFIPLRELEAAVDALKREYDFVLVDVPPSGSEALMGRLADTVLLPANTGLGGRTTYLGRRLSLWPTDRLTARFVLFGARVPPRTKTTVGGALKELAEVAAPGHPLLSRIELSPIVLLEHTAVAEANSHGQLVAEVRHPPGDFLTGIEQLARLCAGAELRTSP